MNQRMTPLVNVIVPVAPAHLQYLPQALDSVRKSSVPVYAITVVNDTGRALDKALIADDISVINTKRRGVSNARNLAIDATETPFVLFLDADDLLVNTALEASLRAFARYTGAAYIYGDAFTVDANGKEGIYRAPTYNQRTFFASNLHNVTALFPTNVLKSIGGFDEEIKGYEDWDLNIRLALAGHCGVRIPMPLILYRLGTGQNRNYSGTIAGEIYADVHQRFAPYIDGRQPIMGCCGSDAAAKAAANNFEAMFAPTPAPDGSVLLEYTGQNEGSIAVRVNGQSYRGANNDDYRFVRARAGDVDQLLALGTWRLVPTAVMQAQKPSLPPAGVTIPSAPDLAPLKARRVRTSTVEA